MSTEESCPGEGGYAPPLADNVTPLHPSPKVGTHIRLTIPVGSIVSSAGDWIVVQYGPDLLQCFNRFTGEPMPHQMLEELVKPTAMVEAETAAQQAREAGAVVLLDKAGRPLTGVRDQAVKLAKPGKALTDLVTHGEPTR